ncbi:MAG: hypothetical protein FWF47_06030, partial [Clostridia bacterium]|nr:hypothetical protein [Clostridia bacterium]
MNIQGCVERLRVYHDRLLTQEVVVIPQTPAILIFLGNQTAQYLTVIRETLHLNISERHWKAVTVGCVTQDSLPIETESLRITVQDKERSFGEYAQEWRAVEGALQQ